MTTVRKIDVTLNIHFDLTLPYVDGMDAIEEAWKEVEKIVGAKIRNHVMWNGEVLQPYDE